MTDARRLYWPLAALVATMATACTTGGDPVARQDTATGSLGPWCEREIRAARSQPVPRGASAEEARILRGRHLSQACGRAYRDSSSITVPITGRDRVPDPLPRPQSD